jgi:flavin reductase (DIM6/NTAB) family NADH-FMN oxidoreductase RutF/DNA-binding IclR family transcriptional regulator
LKDAEVMTHLAPATPPPAIDPMELRRCLGSFVTGVTVITVLDENGAPIGMTANSFNSVSLDPPLIVWSLRTNARTFAVYSNAKRFVVNILSEDQVDISNRFAKSGADRFEGVAVTLGIDGLPLIDGCAAYLECRTEATYPGGDHLLFLGRVERIVGSTRKPLAFGAGKYMVVHPYDNAGTAGQGSANVASLNAVHLARPLLEELNRETDKTVGLGVWGNFGPTLIWWIEASKPLDVRLRCGMVLPLLGSATGKVFAAFSAPEITAPYLEAEIAAAQRLEGSPFISRRAVDEHLAMVRERRLGAITDAVMIDINERGVNAVSAPVFDASGAIVLALTMMGDATTFNETDPAVARLSDAARRLSVRLGHRP